MTRKRLIFVISIVGLLYWGYVLNRWRLSPNRHGEKFTQVQQICSQVPIFPEFREIDSHDSSDYTEVDLTRYFRSANGYQEVKSFYSRAMSADGWILVEEKPYGRGELTFRKSEFVVAIFAAPANASGVEYDYAIDCIWSTRR